MLLNHTEIKLNLPFFNWFRTKRTSVSFQINRKIRNTIWFRCDLTIIRKYLCIWEPSAKAYRVVCWLCVGWQTVTKSARLVQFLQTYSRPRDLVSLGIIAVPIEAQIPQSLKDPSKISLNPSIQTPRKTCQYCTRGFKEDSLNWTPRRESLEDRRWKYFKWGNSEDKYWKL